MIDNEQSHLEQKIIQESPELAASLQEMENDKLLDADAVPNENDEEPSNSATSLADSIKESLTGGGFNGLRRRSHDFLERHGIITKRKKSHTGENVQPKYYPGQKAEIKGVKDRRESEDFATARAIDEVFQPYQEGGFESEPQEEYTILFAYLDEKKTTNSPLSLERRVAFAESDNRLDTLQTLMKLNVVDAVKIVLESGGKNASVLRKRLSFYQDLIQGKATKKEQKYNYQKSEYEDIDVPISATHISRRNIETGLLRDVLSASMVGTPELGAVKTATNRINKKIEEAAQTSERIGRRSRLPQDKIESVVQLTGYYSGIQQGSLGQFEELIKLYDTCLEEVKKRQLDTPLTEDELEHKAVLLTAERLENAYDYAGTLNTSASPYNSSFEESIAVGRLGSRVKRQMAGMRHKIQETDLHNVERFVGKSGDNRYEPERRILLKQIKFLEETKDARQKQEFAAIENESALQRYQVSCEKRADILRRKLERSTQQIEAAELPDEERNLQFQNLQERHTALMAALDQEYQAEVTRLQIRTPEDLLVDLQKQQEAVNEKYEKGKSLAQKALDLHFRFNHVGRLGDDEQASDVKPFGSMIDWINDAPLGTIKRAHTMLRKGISEQTVIELGLTEMILGDEELNREGLRFIHNWVEKAKGDWSEWWQLVMTTKVRSVLSHFHDDLPLSEVTTMVDQLKSVQSRFDYNEQNLRTALDQFSLEDVRKFLRDGNNLYPIVTVKRIADKLGYELTPDIVAEISAHDFNGLEDALDNFDVDTVRTFLSQDINLEVAVAVRKNTLALGNELSPDRIAKISKSVDKHHIEDFVTALENLPLNQVETLFSTPGISYENFRKVQLALEQHQFAADFDATLLMAQKLSKSHEFNNLQSILDVYSLEETEQILAGGVGLSGILGVKQTLEKKNITTDLQEIILFTRYAGSFSQGSYPGDYVEGAIDSFGIEDVRKIVARECPLNKALEVKSYPASKKKSRNNQDQEKGKIVEELIKKGGLDLIIAVAKTPNVETALQILEAGFTVEEITRFPFLISKMVTMLLPETSATKGKSSLFGNDDDDDS